MHFEGFKAEPYKCSAGVWTIGIGSTRKPNGQPVIKDTTAITLDEAKEWKRIHLEGRTLPAVERGLTNIHATQNEVDAISSLVYNCGARVFRWSWFKAMKERQSGVARNLYSKAQKRSIVNGWMKIVIAGGKESKGLRRRRMSEILYFFTGELHYFVKDINEHRNMDYDEYAKLTGRFVYDKLGL
jgi:lysozyme